MMAMQAAPLLVEAAPHIATVASSWLNMVWKVVLVGVVFLAFIITLIAVLVRTGKKSSYARTGDEASTWGLSKLKPWNYMAF